MGTYDELHAQAQAALPAGSYNYFATGTGIEETLVANEAAWRTIGLRPRALRNVASVDTSTTVLGVPLSTPIGVAPTGFQRLAHPDGEVASGKGTAEAGGLFVLSNRASCEYDEFSAVAGPWWFQVYVLRDRDLTERMVQGAVRAGARALVLTGDTPYVGTKARPTPYPAPGRALVPDMLNRDDDGTYQDPTVGLAEIAWLHDISGGLPVVVKGILRADDARASIDAGAAAIWVSNHGGRQLDGAIPTAVALPEVVAAVGSEVEVYVDGGLRNGRDVLRALAMGARAAFLGRPVLWALAAGGSDGVRDLLTNLTNEVTEALALSGSPTIADATSDLLAR
ncbi:alpha-hydroxy acid oxidase [Flindersiella endophytica]